MKKLAGLLAFALALVGAILLTQYYSRPAAPPLPPAPPPPVAQPPAGNVNVTFKPQLITLDPAAGKGYATLTLERDPAGPAPATVWVWAYFFSPDAPGRYCAGEPVEVRQPFAGGDRPGVKIELPVKGCPAPRTPSSTFYARVNVSSESAFAARLTEQRISYDITQASPVVVQGAAGRPK